MSSGILTLEQAILRFGCGKHNDKRSVPSADDCAQGGRPTGHRVVFTNGCFDLLHPGHIRTLETARHLGDALIVGLNSDNGVRQLKGPDRRVISVPVAPGYSTTAIVQKIRAGAASNTLSISGATRAES